MILTNMIRDPASQENYTQEPEIRMGESVQRGPVLVSDYLSETVYTDHIAETFVLLLLCVLLLIYKIVDIFRKIIKYRQVDGETQCSHVDEASQQQAETPPTLRVYGDDSGPDSDDVCTVSWSRPSRQQN